MTGAGRDFSLKQWMLAGLLLMPWVADAAGLGRLTLLSALGQPFLAEIELISVGKDELNSLSAKLAPPEVYRQKNLQFNQAMTGMRLTVERRSGGQVYIRLASGAPVNDPFADLLVELQTPTGSITREYVVLLDPPGYGANASAIVSPPVAAAQTRPAPSQTVAASPLPAQKTAEAARPAPAAAQPASAQKYGPVRRGETLGKIARSLKPAEISLEQMLAGLYRSNPNAFVNNNMNLLKVGATLQVPDKQELAAVPHQEAVKEYRVQVANWKNYRRNVADAARPAAADSKSADKDKSVAASGPESVKVIDKADSSKGAKPVLRLSSGAPEAGKASTPDRVRALEEEIVAQGKALDEANERIKRLEKALQNPAPATPK
jgi:pilus assembly protein FimV